MDWDETLTGDRELRGPTMRPPSRLQTRVAAVLVALAVGFLVGVQAGSEDAGGRLAAESPEDLTRILADLNAEAERLAGEVSELRVRMERYRSSAERDELLLRDARRTLADLQVLSGTVPVEGPGVLVLVGDPQGRVTWDLLLDLVQELRDGGAEAIAVGGLRVVASTWFGPASSGVVVDGERVLSPYRISAIGPPADLREALQIPGGSVAVLSSLPEVRLEVSEQEDLRLPALRRQIAFRYARPAP